MQRAFGLGNPSDRTLLAYLGYSSQPLKSTNLDKQRCDALRGLEHVEVPLIPMLASRLASSLIVYDGTQLLFGDVST